jgi:hypothetical protein
MGKESARLDGPKPIIINQDCEWLIRELIVSGVNGKLGPDHAIIVRNDEKREDVPKWLKDMGGFVMTIE